ncbi:MAG: FAD:protein FMN transferase [Nitrospiraceae bacterium]|nr:FAD:protein FMN transferase [Nitrospiraceae bacterium]
MRKLSDSKKNIICSAVFLFCSFFILSACGEEKEKVYRKSVILMDTRVEISVVSNSSEKAEKAIDKAFVEIEKLETLLNFFSEKSELSEINKNAGIKPVKVSPETFDIFEKALYVSEKTYGAFDITTGSQIVLWDFTKKIKPDDLEIKKRLRLVNYKNIILNKKEQTVYLKKKNMSADLGGIAKGYAADKATEILKANGIRAGLVAIAGDIKAFGMKPDGKPWKIGIRNPRQKGEKDEIIATIELVDSAVSTSGDYERYFISNGKRYHHILDPKTGYPSAFSQTAVVIAKNGYIADSFSTGVFIIGYKKGLSLLDNMKIEGMIIDSSGKIHMTESLKDKIEVHGN